MDYDHAPGSYVTLAIWYYVRDGPWVDGPAGIGPQGIMQGEAVPDGNLTSGFPLEEIICNKTYV